MVSDCDSGCGGGGNRIPAGAAGGAGGGANGPASLQYSIPGILHFLQHEWSRFEMERGHWDVEKAELQVSLFPHCPNCLCQPFPRQQL